MKYSVIDKSEIDNMVWEDLVTTSKDTIRWNTDETKAIVKFEGDSPNFLNDSIEYTLEEILAIINDDNNNWIYENPDSEY
uniref:Uncharacterized protein n=1 Tax=Virus NIOZ-UU157 TaxID=2763269 RepID=A0A7S9STP9_9VIRU|nr:MAG: hypothetical protein NIOZUU157_00055 [Virus NIOZ-UU157]|tara:strand:+ start:929 stop:1168 length:240 start_codon:yes stop_codon:yes gene_type:complete